MKKTLLLLFISFQIQALAQTATPTSLEYCDDNNDGYAMFDLTIADTHVLNGQSFNDYAVSYFGTLADAQTGVNQLMSDYMNVTPYFQTVYSRVEDLNTDNFATSSVDLIVAQQPEANQAPDLVSCGNEEGVAIFDLTLNVSIILGTQNESDFILSYYEFEADAESGTNAIAMPITYANPVQPQQIWVRVENSNTGCYNITDFDIIAVNCSVDTDNDLVATADEDVNGNGNLNDDDTDGDGLRNYEDEDDDGDGVLTADEDYNGNGDPTDDDTDSSGTPDYLESNVALAVNVLDKIELLVYPNPTNGKLNLLYKNSINRVEIYNVLGEKLKQISFPENQQNYVIEVANFNPGAYFVQIYTGGKSTVKKFIVD